MSISKLMILGLLAGLAAMAAATWHYGVTGGPLVARVGSSGMLLILIATVIAMVIVALWRPRKPVVSERAPGWEPEASAEEIEVQLQREASYEERMRRSAEAKAANSFTGKSGF